jgi:uncharacterized protein YjbI with pentapeptide repeats
MRYSVLSVRAIWWAAALILVVGVGVAVWLLLAYGRGDTQQRNQLEAIKTAGTIVIGTGGAAALLLAARRQRTAEIALKQKDRDQAHQERVAAATEMDAVERRITELYTKAADQLGSDKAPVRLAGLYALERLAQDNPGQRQPIVNVMCAYLRMPYQPPRTGQHRRIGVRRPLHTNNTRRRTASLVTPVGAEAAVQEREVRLAAQRLLADHLRPGPVLEQPVVTFWAGIDLDLTGATLIDLNFTGCAPHTATFTTAEFTGTARFDWAQFTGDARFGGAWFTGAAGFSSARFAGAAEFGRARFADTVDLEFSRVQFTGDGRIQFTHRVTAGVNFGGAEFTAGAGFVDAQFTGQAEFSSARFAGDAEFSRAQFTAGAEFSQAQFTAGAWFGQAKFGGGAQFGGAQFTGDVEFGQAQFSGDAEFGRAQFGRGVPVEVAEFVSSSAADGKSHETDMGGTAQQSPFLT